MKLLPARTSGNNVLFGKIGSQHEHYLAYINTSASKKIPRSGKQKSGVSCHSEKSQFLINFPDPSHFSDPSSIIAKKVKYPWQRTWNIIKQVDIVIILPVLHQSFLWLFIKVIRHWSKRNILIFWGSMNTGCEYSDIRGLKMSHLFHSGSSWSTKLSCHQFPGPWVHNWDVYI